VLFFKRILNFSSDAIAQKEKRANTRYPIGSGFPVKAILNISGRDGNGQTLSPDGRNGQDWGGWMLNLSNSGVSMQLHPAVLTRRGEACRFRLVYENYQLELDAQVAHFRTYPNYSVCGVSLKFPDAEMQKAFLQVIEPVVIGSSFKPVDSKRIKQDTPDLIKEQYTGDSKTRLTVWRAAGENSIAGFDLQIGPYSVAGSNQSPDLDVTADADGGPDGKLTAGSREEVRQLFRLIVPNLAKSVPPDVRKFLARY